jgi:hypothetical protein
MARVVADEPDPIAGAMAVLLGADAARIVEPARAKPLAVVEPQPAPPGRA